ncbi:MAG: hypothetical protein KGD63_15685 [Candidatus Lokiarchaeota archaeon]|nr:hypothetical protein [Candidatus Lokiarchaeota archaeon]
MKNSKSKKLDILYKHSKLLGGIILLIIVSIFLLAIIEICIGGIKLFQNLFIIKLIKVHTEIIEEESLVGINLLDMMILILLVIITTSLYPILKHVNKVGAILAFVQPFIGILLFIITEETGRTAFFSTGLTIAIILLGSDVFNKKVIYVGLLANIFLLIPDICLAWLNSITLGVIMGIGYLLVIPFFILISWELISFNKRKHGLKEK